MIANLALAGLALLGASAAPAAGDEPTAIELEGKRTSMDGPDKPEAGNSMVSTLKFTDTSGADFGEVDVHCVIAEVVPDKGPDAICHGTLSTDEGALYLAGRNPMHGDYPREHTIAVLGGTGKYAGARGEAEIVNPDMTTTKMTIRLVE